MDKINQHTESSTTDSALLGPFYVEGRPTADNGSDISDGVGGTPMFVTGRVVDDGGNPIAGAKVDTWHSDGEGFYDVQQTEKLHDQLAMRALLTTDDDGRFWYRSITPRYYPVPTDGPCGEILRAANRSPMRPQHVHFWVHAQGYAPLITQVFLRDDPYIDRDAVFAVQDSLKADFQHHEPGTAPDGTSVDEPFVTLDWTLTLASRRRIAKGRSQCHGYRSSASSSNPNRSASSWHVAAISMCFECSPTPPTCLSGGRRWSMRLFDSPTFSLRMREVVILRVAHLQGTPTSSASTSGSARVAA